MPLRRVAYLGGQRTSAPRATQDPSSASPSCLLEWPRSLSRPPPARAWLLCRHHKVTAVRRRALPPARLCRSGKSRPRRRLGLALPQCVGIAGVPVPRAGPVRPLRPPGAARRAARAPAPRQAAATAVRRVLRLRQHQGPPPEVLRVWPCQQGVRDVAEEQRARRAQMRRALCRGCCQLRGCPALRDAYLWACLLGQRNPWSPGSPAVLRLPLSAERRPQ